VGCAASIARCVFLQDQKALHLDACVFSGIIVGMKGTINLRLYTVFPFLRWWPQINTRTARADLVAGLTGAIIVVPQGVAFANYRRVAS
jgi:hypothetical protein